MKTLTKKTSLTIVIFIFTQTIYAQQFYLLKNEKEFNNTDSSQLQGLYKKAIKEKDSIKMIQKGIQLSRYKRIHLDYGAAFDYAGEALFLSEQLRDTLLIAEAHQEYGILNYLFKQDNLAGTNFKKSHFYYKQVYKDKTHPKLFNSYYNLILYYQRTDNASLTKSYIDSCEIVAKHNNLNSSYQLYLNEKKATLYRWNEDYLNAEKLLKESILLAKKTKKDSGFLIILYASLGNIYQNKNEINNAKIYYQKSINTKDTYGENTFYKAYVYNRYASLLFANGDYKNAYVNLNYAAKINDTYLNPRNDENQSFLTLKSKYQEQLTAFSSEINQQQNQMNRIEKRILLFKIYLTIALLIIALTLLLTWIKIKATKHKEEQEFSENTIALNNKELTTNILNLIEKEEIINTLKSHIKKNNTDSSSKVLLKTIDKRSENLWDAFNSRFVAQNKGFYERLLKKSPDLTASDLKLCALIKLNFNGKEMAYLLGISLGSVHVARHRLRKKMNLDRNINLTIFMNSI
ncbi:DNA-binding CsgD family transcriptional regulator [Wenyingzhuangia heitensis]|uniref:DNA-binding CsgD family transcriptional regulator n=1 Tax=Wenyingzhuangia heitensis TaxID=1487859 RepID=A0ABX0UBX3_9FLAO|nr:hypothetical protein [Wenyingzhuangia heitensis]NIJ45325.1 DNA-binding CsgD family transcriptional regulator [Wenyingzhuangia heitensis]